MSHGLLLPESQQFGGRLEGLRQSIVVEDLAFLPYGRGGCERNVAQGDGNQVAELAVGREQP